MASKKQITANKNNSKKSTGPISKLGKLKSSQNAIKHGLTAKQLIIGEDISQFENYRDRMTSELKPIGTTDRDTQKTLHRKYTFHNSATTVFF